MSDVDPAAARRRHSQLMGVKLRALVGDQLGQTIAEPTMFAPGAALLHDDEAWVLLDDRPAQRLGACLVWALRAGARSLHVIADLAADAAVLARRASAFSFPITVWQATGRTLDPAMAAAPISSGAAPDAHMALRQLIVDGGAAPLVEHGVLLGEVRGLEVCRVVDDPHLQTVRLEVGVGAHDREAFQMLHGDVPTVESLARIVDAVAVQRAVGAAPHPLNRLAAERFIRWRLEVEPALVSAGEVGPAAPPVPRSNLKDPTPCVASGVDDRSRPLRVVCASGVDLDLIPFAADARLTAEAAEPGVEGEERLLVVTPGRDRIAAIAQIAALLRRPVEFASID